MFWPLSKKEMLGTLAGWLRWSAPESSSNKSVDPSEIEHGIWLEWQSKQPPIHYEKSEIFQYYLISHPEFMPPAGSVLMVEGRSSGYYHYCFGDFTSILVKPETGSNAIEYFALLLDIYDTCKGFSRRIKGDPVGITVLRQAVTRKCLTPLFNHDFNEYAYDYGQLHAHTVCQYSLSTLLMRFVSNYMSQTQTREYYPYILIDGCQRAYENCLFGEQTRLAASASIAIRKPSSTSLSQMLSPSNPDFKMGFTPRGEPWRRQIHEKAAEYMMPASPSELGSPTMAEWKPCSWPRDPSTCLRCRKCFRITENIYGTFYACLDCYMKRICYVCGEAAVVISHDSYPRCPIHQ